MAPKLRPPLDAEAFGLTVEKCVRQAERLTEQLHRLSYLAHMPVRPPELAGAQQALDAVELTLDGITQFTKAEADRWHL